MQRSSAPTPIYPQVERRFFYTGKTADACFAWQHFPASARARNHSVIICPPLGYEYTHSHRSLKHLAEFLANKGFVTFRFDYHGTGDSPGWDFDENRVETWINNIVTLVNEAKEKYPEHVISLVGVRLGATLASLATQHLKIDHLVLWEPIVKGSSYVRELTAVARLAETTKDLTDDWVESAGFLMTTPTLKSIKQINLSEQAIKVNKSILIVARDDRSTEQKFSEKLLVGKTSIVEKILPGFADMMEEPQDTKVPFIAIEAICDWLISESDSTLKKILPLVSSKKAPSLIFPLPNSPGVFLEEMPCWYNPDDLLFGIATHRKHGHNKNLPAVILLNSGSVHHVGPNRIYIEIARQLAAKGFYVLRLDLEGLGDSTSSEPGRENHPYQHHAVSNAFAAIEFLRNTGIAEKFIVGGVCSGAHAGFHCALAEQHKSYAEKLIPTVLLINPLTFYWKEGMSLATSVKDDTQTIRDKNQYTKSVRDPGKWKKLLSGKVSIFYIMQFVLSLIAFKIKSRINHFAEVIGASKKPLSIDLNTLVKSGLKIEFIFSSTDPGLDIVKKDAAKSLAKGIASKHIDLSIIDDANHTFSKKAMREKLSTSIDAIFNRIHF